MTTVPDALTRLTAALDRLAAALESGRPEAVLEAEAPLATAVGVLRAADPATIHNHPQPRAALLQVRLAVARCRTLGHAAAQVLAVVTAADPAENAYGRSGRPVGASRLATVSSRS